jgi:tetratricopeptide (TPR) repeat protein
MPQPAHRVAQVHDWTKRWLSHAAKALQGDRRFYLAYLAFFGAAVAWQLFQAPLSDADTDLWFHLDNGRYILTQGKLPSSSFFSFIQPPRACVDYSWLFQVMVYGVHQFAGHVGLIVMRNVLCLSLCATVFLFLARGGARQPTLRYSIFATVLLFLAFLPRSLNFRPHAFTYLLAALFLFILENGRRTRWILPGLALLWVNVHGITFPVAVVMSLCFVAESFVDCLRKPGPGRWKSAALREAPVLVACAAGLANPNGWRLFRLSLQDTNYTVQYVSEGRFFTLEDLSSFGVTGLVPAYQSLWLAVIVLAAVCFLVVATRRELSLSQALLFLAAVVLLFKGMRAAHEGAVLALPVLRDGGPRRPALAGSDSAAAASSIPAWSAGWAPKALLTLVLLLVPFLALRESFRIQARYPVTYRLLPRGIATVLNRWDVGGNVLSHPNTAGYLRWELKPKYRIYMDLEVPFLFTDEDFFLGANAFTDPIVLKKLVDEYHPPFIASPLVHGGFQDVIRNFPQYRPVFLDDVDVLFADAAQNPTLVERNELKELNPYELNQPNLAPVLGLKNLDRLLSELNRLLSVFPESGKINFLLGMVANLRGRSNEALPYADQVIAQFPDAPAGYSIKGDALKALGVHDKAVEVYRQSLDRLGNRPERKSTLREMGRSYLALGDNEHAYKAFEQAVNVFAPDSTIDELRDLGLAALRSGRREEALFALKLARDKVPEENRELCQQLGELLRAAGGNVE